MKIEKYVGEKFDEFIRGKRSNYKRLTTISEINGKPMLIEQKESCGEDSCFDTCLNFNETNCVECPIQKAFTRLYEYENCGLSPEQVSEFIKANVFIRRSDVDN